MVGVLRRSAEAETVLYYYKHKRRSCFGKGGVYCGRDAGLCIFSVDSRPFWLILQESLQPPEPDQLPHLRPSVKRAVLPMKQIVIYATDPSPRSNSGPGRRSGGLQENIRIEDILREEQLIG